MVFQMYEKYLHHNPPALKFYMLNNERLSIRMYGRDRKEEIKKPPLDEAAP